MRTNSNQFLNQQYGNSSKLDARIRLHKEYSTNRIDWHEWVFDNIQFDDESNIIEFGCGSGYLWTENLMKIRENWSIILTDFSKGMVSQAQRNIPEKQNITFGEMDIQATHLEHSLFDIVIANHMLYHVPNIETALKEVQRILKPNGLFYAATNGNSHMKEIYHFVKEFDSSLPFIKPVHSTYFGLENGEKALRSSFNRVQLLKYESNLRVTNVQDLADYIFSIDTGLEDALNKQGRYDQFISFLESKKNTQGYIHISKDSGMYVGSEPY